MRKIYITPIAEKVSFRYMDQVVAASPISYISGSCEDVVDNVYSSGDPLTDALISATVTSDATVVNSINMIDVPEVTAKIDNNLDITEFLTSCSVDEYRQRKAAEAEAAAAAAAAAAATTIEVVPDCTEMY